jgi:hypothetical protein
MVEPAAASATGPPSPKVKGPPASLTPTTLLAAALGKTQAPCPAGGAPRQVDSPKVAAFKKAPPPQLAAPGGGPVMKAAFPAPHPRPVASFPPARDVAGVRPVALPSRAAPSDWSEYVAPAQRRRSVTPPRRAIFDGEDDLHLVVTPAVRPINTPPGLAVWSYESVEALAAAEGEDPAALLRAAGPPPPEADYFWVRTLRDRRWGGRIPQAKADRQCLGWCAAPCPVRGFGCRLRCFRPILLGEAAPHTGHRCRQCRDP